MDEALGETNLRDATPREILDIHEESPLEVEKDGDINEHKSYFMCASTSPCLYEKSPDSSDLFNIPKNEIFNPLVLPIPKYFERVVVDAYVYHKYYSSHYIGLNLEIGTHKLVLKGKPLHQNTS